MVEKGIHKAAGNNEGDSSHVGRSSQGSNDDAEAFEIEAPGPTQIAKRVTKLKQSALSAAAKRDRLPQMLFWSLLRCEIEQIKKRKEKLRLLREIS